MVTSQIYLRPIIVVLLRRARMGAGQLCDLAPTLEPLLRGSWSLRATGVVDNNTHTHTHRPEFPSLCLAAYPSFRRCQPSRSLPRSALARRAEGGWVALRAKRARARQSIGNAGIGRGPQIQDGQIANRPYIGRGDDRLMRASMPDPHSRLANAALMHVSYSASTSPLGHDWAESPLSGARSLLRVCPG